MRNSSLSAVIGTALIALMGVGSAHAQDAAAPPAPPAAPAPDAAAAPAAPATPAPDAPAASTANGPGPATQPPPPPGTTTPAPTQAPAAPTPPGTSSGPSPEAPAAPAAAPPPNYNIQTSGLIDGYYMLDLRNTSGTLIQGTGRSYDQRIKTPALALAELNVFKNPKPAGLGFKATLIAGDTADINHANFNAVANPVTGAAAGSTNGNTGEAQFKNVQQLYGTYAFAGGGGVDVGKFYTPLGYEVTEANGDYNYSRSLPYFILPVYHAGARIYTPSLNGLTATAYITNNLYNTATAGVHDPTSDKAFLGQINFTDPAGKFVFIATYGYGKKDIAGADATAADVDFTYNLTANQIVAANYTYVKFNGNGTPDAKTNGYAVYYRQALTPKNAVALRFSGLDANSNAGGGKPKEVTLTYEVKPTTAFTTRLEYRHDFSNQEVFLGGKNDTSGSKNQDTLTLAGLFTF